MHHFIHFGHGAGGGMMFIGLVLAGLFAVALVSQSRTEPSK